MKLFMAIPFKESEIEVVSIDCMDKSVKAVAEYFQDKCGGDIFFRFVPPVEEQIKRMEKKKN